jgi:chorismate synthase
MRLRVLTAGESHGPALVAVVDGVPSGLSITPEQIDRDLARRQRGYGRGGRMGIESDSVRITSGVRLGRTLGSPIAMVIENRDHSNWSTVMSVTATDSQDLPRETRPRPGHGDLAGMLKHDTTDARDVLERASARDTAARTAAGAVARRFLEELRVDVFSRVVRIGSVALEREDEELSVASFVSAEDDPVRCSDPEEGRRMIEEIERATTDGDSLGGVFEVAAFGLIPGLGSTSQADRRMDARLTGAIASIPGIKGVEVGHGFGLASLRGSEAHDEIFFHSERGVVRGSNRAGGLEAGMTNGEPLVLRAAMKPIPTLSSPLATIDVETREPTVAFKERADACAVPAAAVVGEAVVATVLADAVLEKFGGDTMDDVVRSLGAYLDRLSPLWRREA